MRIAPFPEMLAKSRKTVSAAEIGKHIQSLQAQYDNALLGLCDGHPDAVTAMRTIAQKLGLHGDGQDPQPTEAK